MIIVASWLCTPLLTRVLLTHTTNSLLIFLRVFSFLSKYSFFIIDIYKFSLFFVDKRKI